MRYGADLPAVRVLVINGNSSDHITTIIRREATLAAMPGMRVRVVGCSDGPQFIQRPADNARSTSAILSLVKNRRKDYDAIVVAVSLDTAVQRLREVADVPVIGMTQAAFLAARIIGPRVGALIFGRHLVSAYRRLFATHVSPNMHLAVRESTLIPAEIMSSRDIDSHIITDLSNFCSSGRHVDSIVIVGAALAGAARRLQSTSAVPLLDGVSCGVRLAGAAAATLATNR